MSDAHAFLAFAQITDDLPGEVGRQLATQRNLATEEAHDVAATQADHGLLQQAWVEPPQRGRITEDDIDGPLALICGPVIGRRMGTEELLVNRIQTVGNLRKSRRPIHGELLIQQVLGLLPVFDPRKAVVLTRVGQPTRVHLSRQPLSAIETDLNRKREPALNTRMQKAKDGMNGVVVQEQALAYAWLEL